MVTLMQGLLITQLQVLGNRVLQQVEVVGVTSHANVAAFPASPSEGDLAYAQDTDALYLRKLLDGERIDNGGESPVITTMILQAV